MEDAVVALQKVYRGGVVRQKLTQEKDGAVLIQKGVRSFLTRKHEKTNNAARILQHAWKRRQHVVSDLGSEPSGGSVGDIVDDMASIEIRSRTGTPTHNGTELSPGFDDLELENMVLRQELSVLRTQLHGREMQVIEYESELRMARMMIEALANNQPLPETKFDIGRNSK
eukprot:TRINITY_DN13436_c0_g1_i3.p2 TRINITY_DN13436_c0_g1~~TRINITY_DN13436_c0_g1_i3.p2  ORF type:complete len:170 (+),score=38.53 TRINITY_DN13436_c0_g1_i3:1021-1530(+)